MLRFPSSSSALWLFASAVVVGLFSCESECNRGADGDAVQYRQGTTADSFYETSPFSGPLLDFPTGAKWEIFHDLGAIPWGLDAFVAFSECPTTEPCGNMEGDDTGLTLAAGNAVTFHSVTAESVIVRNDTCADFFLRVQLSVPAQQ